LVQRITLDPLANDSVDVMRLGGEVDLGNSRDVAEALLDHVSEDSPGLVIDLSGLRYVDSAGIRLFVELSERLRRNRQTLALAVPSDAPIHRTLSIVKMELLVPVHESVEDAVEDIATRSDSRPTVP
jgi:anti-sigma B factor antagonist